MNKEEMIINEDLTIEFDGAEGGRFWFVINDENGDIFEIKKEEAVKLIDFLKYWSKK
jgi:hypothetical protein